MSAPLREVRGWEYMQPFAGPDRWVATLSCGHTTVVWEEAAKWGSLPCEDCERATVPQTGEVAA